VEGGSSGQGALHCPLAWARRVGGCRQGGCRQIHWQVPPPLPTLVRAPPPAASTCRHLCCRPPLPLVAFIAGLLRRRPPSFPVASNSASTGMRWTRIFAKSQAPLDTLMYLVYTIHTYILSGVPCKRCFFPISWSSSGRLVIGPWRLGPR
jgi:hypothetical protein